MRSKHRSLPPRIALVVTVGLSLTWPACVWPQSITATVSTVGRPYGLAINRTTNKIYVSQRAPFCMFSCPPAVSGSVIDGTTHGVATVQSPTGAGRTLPAPLAVNEITNKIYVASSGGTVVIDGATNATTLVVDPNAKVGSGGSGGFPSGFAAGLAVNPSTNKIYVANGGGNITVINGATNSTTTVTDPNASGLVPTAVAINPVTNKIYVVNSTPNPAPGGTGPGNVTVIDGATNSTTTVTDPNAFDPVGVAVNTITNQIYVANLGNFPSGVNHGNVTVIDGATNATTTITDPNALNPGYSSQGLAVAVNSTTNRIYVVNGGSDNVTVIDGAANSTSTVTDRNAAAPVAVAVNEVTNTVYVANMGGCNPVACVGASVTVIDGGNGSTATLIDANAVDAGWWMAIAVDPATNKIYALYGASAGRLAIIDGGLAATTRTLAAHLAGNGAGTVISNPAGIDCGASDCAASFALGTNVKLSATAASGSYFAGWGGSCTGTNSCDLMTNEDQFVTATFSPAVTVPKVVSMTQTAAAAAVLGAGLVIGTVTQQPSNAVPSGSVISESPAAGTSVAPGSAVNMVVSGDPSGSSGGGGSIDLLTLGSILGCLLFAVRRVRVPA
jgi:DNA-binding beta-propeller fold protein YncE